MEEAQEKSKQIRRSKEDIQQLVLVWQQSGKSKSLFCKENQLNYLTFMSWTNPPKKKKHKVKSPAITGFIPLEIKNKGSEFFVEVHLLNGNKISFYEPVAVEYLRSLVR